MSGPLSLRSSGVMVPSVLSSAETDPLLPSAAMRTASSALSSPAAAISANSLLSSEFKSDMTPTSLVSPDGAKRNPGRRTYRRSPWPGHCPGQANAASEKQDWDQAAAGNAALACSTIAWNAAGSCMARSDSTLRSTNSPAFARPSINRL